MTQMENSKQKNRYRKVYQHRESMFTTIINENDHFRAIFNIAFSFVILFLVTTIGDYLNKPEKLAKIYEIFIWNLIDLGKFLQISFAIHLVTIFLHYSLVLLKNYLQFKNVLEFCKKNYTNDKNIDALYERYVEQRPNIQLPLVRVIFHLIYALISAIGLLAYASRSVYHLNISVAFSFGAAVETIRLIMKAHSFYIEKKDLNIEKETMAKWLNENEHLSSQLFWQLSNRPMMKKFLYFLVAPTICYQDSYPQTERICWTKVFNYFTQFIITCFTLFLIVCNFMEQYSDVGLVIYQRQNLFQTIIHATLIGSVFWALIFYGFLHVWHNFTAELFRFGDRFYYEDWWNSISLKEFYRKWNIVVQDWIFLYIYVPIYYRYHKRTLASFTAILISAIVHEYILFITFRYSFPVMFFEFAIGGYLLFLFTRNVRRNKWQNLLFLLLNMLGWGTLILSYTLEWNSRKNCHSQASTPLQDLFLPRVLSCIKF